ncbi:MAG TPA: dihydropteroate synthase, partial [Hyphomonas atlantica]|nr:dihydropteroate synthase [Hyphomonas atlantica]
MAVRDRLLARLRTGDPLIMGILNVTPDSFSDGGVHDSLA